MPDPKIDLTGAKIPHADGEINEYAYKEATAAKAQFRRNRKVIFINGMGNQGNDHAKSALALSWVQMCTVVGVYNATGGTILDLAQCLGDKDQFNGPVSFSADTKVAVGQLLKGQTPVATIRDALSRNAAQVALFDLLRRPKNPCREIFAHSQGNLILSNVLQGIEAVDGNLSGYTVHTFGSPTVNWPENLKKYEHAFTWDPVSFLAGFDSTWTISKVGMPAGSMNPITHGFIEYIKRDPSFVVNRFRWGGLGVTLNMDEDGLAKAIAAMGTNTKRIKNIFEHLNKNHNSDADDVAVRYIGHIKQAPATQSALKADKPLVSLLIKILDEGWTSSGEKKAMAFLQAL